MADKKISALTAATTPLAGTEVLPIVQSGSTVKVSIADVTAGRTVNAANLVLSGDAAIGTSITTGIKLGLRGAQTSTVIGCDNGVNTGFVVKFSPGLTNIGNDFSQPLGFLVNNVQQAKIEATGNYTLNTGNLVIGTAGKGIDFSAATHAAGMTSELLNDYEEGTFTPTWNGGTVTTNSAFYTKIGRMVTLIVDVTFGASASGASSVLTVPFTVGGTWGFGAVNFTDVSATISVNVDSGINGVAFRTAINTGNVSCVALSTKRVVFGATYFV